MTTRPVKVWDGSAWISVGVLAPDTTNYVVTTRTLTAGSGLSGGGDLSADRTLSLATASLALLSPLGKADPASVVLSKTGAGTASIKANTYVVVGSTLVTFSSATAITMPTLTAGTDYYVYVKNDGTAQAVAATGTWPTPVASPPASSVLIGGFHYAPGGNATAQAGGDTTAAINAYSMWDLKWRPAAPDPRGMTLVADTFWCDIYLLNRDPQTNGTSANGKDIADSASGTTTAIIPTMYGGNGSTRYGTMTWWNTAEALNAFGKRLLTIQEFPAAYYGTTENASRGSDAVTTGIGTSNNGSSNTDEKFTSKWGVMQATGVMWQWADHQGGIYTSGWTNTNGGRGWVNGQPNAVFAGGYWSSTTQAGSRAGYWSYAPSDTGETIGGRGACNHRVII